MSLVAHLTVALESRDPHLRGHCGRVTAFAEAIALRLGWGEKRLAGLRLGGALHDVGKLAISETVLRKPGPLTCAEVAHIRTHPEAGARLLGGIESLSPALPYVLFHHERWDGSGYPHGLAGEAIPTEGRLLAVADAFDAMISARPYRPALFVHAALAELDRCAGSQFDPQVAQAFLATWHAGEIAAAEPLPAASGL